MQRQPLRGPSPYRATPGRNRGSHWIVLSAASFIGFAFLVILWTWLPPGTVIGLAAQAQAQARAASQQTSAHASTSSSPTAEITSQPTKDTSAHSQTGSRTRSNTQPLAAGTSLLKQSQQQLQQQHTAASGDARKHSTRNGVRVGTGGGTGGTGGGDGGSAHLTAHGAGGATATTGAARSSFLRGSGGGGGGDASSASGTAITKESAGSASTAMQQQAQGSGTAAAAAALPLPPRSARVVVVGGGLAGLTAALQAAECLAAAAAVGAAGAADRACPEAQCTGGGAATAAGAGAASASFDADVLLVEKMPRLGGNSAKASSGINALHPEGGDSEGAFRADVLASGGGASREGLVEQLVEHSREAIAFLHSYGVQLPGVTRLGGHSVARTRTVTGGANVGWAIMSALTAAARAHPRIRVLEGYALRRIITDQDGSGGGGDSDGGGGGGGVTGVELAAAAPDGSVPAVAADGGGGGVAAAARVACGALILATGGFAANREMLQSVAPEAAGLATTNGPWARGEALRLAAEAGAGLTGLDDVQVHPTGFVDPTDPGAGTKFLAPEKLRGVGGLLLDGQGARFVDELARRDVVSGAVMRLPGRTAWLLLGRDAAAEYGGGAVEFYVKKGLMRKAESVAEAAAAMGVAEATLARSLTEYAAAAAAAAAAAGGGGAAADPTGKHVFPHPPHPAEQLPLYVARVTPVVHYTMGGVAINERAQALRQGGGRGAEGGGGGEVVRGLYAAGEVSGGLHGHNRLGGNSLLECVVFGRIAGAQAAACGGA